MSGPSARSVSASRWSVWACEDVTTSTNPSADGSTTSSVIRSCGLSVSAYLRVSESDRYGSSSRWRPCQATRKPLWPSHQRCSAPGSARRTSSSSASPDCSGRITMRRYTVHPRWATTRSRSPARCSTAPPSTASDPDWLAAQAADPAARAVVASDAGIHVIGDEPRLALVPLAALPTVEPLLLGLDAAGPVFAVDADGRVQRHAAPADRRRPVGRRRRGLGHARAWGCGPPRPRSRQPTPASPRTPARC